MKGLAVLCDSLDFEIFKAIDADVKVVNDEKIARFELKNLAKENSIIFVSESLAKVLEKQIKSYENKIYPIILILPSNSMSDGLAFKNIAKKAKDCLGVNIFKE